MQDTGKKKGITRNIVLTGFTSFFTDVSSEMIYPLLQAFVSMIMASKKTLLGPILGIIEGIAESTASLLKVFFGYYSDKIQNRKLPAIAGYSTSALAKFLLLLSSFGWYFVLLARLFDRVGKGIRTAPRDALISESTPNEMQGKAFGFHRGMDFAGATLGALICFFLVLHFIDPITRTLKDLNSFYTLFLISIIPALIGILFLFFIKEKKLQTAYAAKNNKPKPNLNIRQYDKNLQIFFFAQLIFTLGNSSNQFLLLRSMNLGYALSTVVLMYLIFNLSTSLLSTAFGSLSDRIGRKKLLIAGYGLYAIVYISFGFISHKTNFLLWFFWPLYGIYYAMTEGIEKAFVSDIAPEDSKATALGFYHTIVGIGLLPASIIAGILFFLLPSAPFIFGGALALVTVVILAFFVKEKGGKGLTQS
ncbi:MAG: MFS transporter [Deltaproteobacteria bacterium]|nr:MFS transporter [Deltaproteobacteria bacterium]MBW2105121.1 MFS transporter [Deltaproteobacteria bacterium]MBW2332556.1 MFS transporter [Deltaproteobacteria bacterium]HDH88372.1 MFS transporter [Desulfobacteraceae bacterium]